MKNGVYLIAIGTLVATACSLPIIKTSWSKPGASRGEFQRAKEACSQERGMAGLGGQAGFEVCMKQKGWFLIEEVVQ